MHSINIYGNYNPYAGKEDDLQKTCMKWIAMAYPKVIAFHSPNGGKRNAREAAKFKAMGVVAGIPDIIILHPKGHFHGMCIELKSKKNKATKNQIDILTKLQAQDYSVCICYNIDSVIEVVQKYMAL